MRSPFAAKTLDFLVFFLLAVLSLGLYVRTAAPSILPADSGEFQFASYILGIVHPTGYPLYLLLGKMFTYLPLGDVAFRVTLMSSVWAALGVGFTYLTCVYLTRTLPLPGKTTSTDTTGQTKFGPNDWAIRIAAVTAAGAIAISDTFWSQATRAEVYSLNSLLFLATCWLLLSFEINPQQRKWLLPILGLVMGLGLAHHRTYLLFFPSFIFFLLAVTQREKRLSIPQGNHPDRGDWARFLMLLTLPLFSYILIPLRAGASTYLFINLSPDQQLALYDNSLAGFLRQITGSGFAGQLGTGLTGGIESRLRLFGNLFIDQMGPLSLTLAVLGVILLAWKLPSKLQLIVGCFGFLFTFTLFYGIGDIQDFLTPLYLIVALCIPIGLLLPFWLVRIGSGWIPLLLTTIVGGILLLTLPFSQNFGKNDLSQQWGPRKGWEEILKQPLEPGAVLASNDRDEMVPLWYFQQVEGVRTDLIGLFPNITNAPDHANIVRLLDYALASGRPVYLIKQLPEIALKFQTEAEGSLVRIEGSYATIAPQNALSVKFGDQLLLRGYQVTSQTDAAAGKDGISLREGETLDFTLSWEVLGPMPADYSVFVHFLNDNKQLAAQQDLRLGGLVYPTSRWETGERLVSQHQIKLPTNLRSGEYSINIGIYDSQTMKRISTVNGPDTTTPFTITVR